MKFNLVNLFKHKKVIICFLILAFIFCFIFIYYSFEEGFTNVDVIKNGDFTVLPRQCSMDNPEACVGYLAALNSIHGWTIQGIKPKEQSNDKYALASSENGGLLVKINIYPNKDILVSQIIELEEGETYKLTFSYAGRNASKLNVHIDGIPIGSNYVAEGIQKTDAINYTSMKTGQHTLSFTINSGNFTRGETTLLLSKISMTQQTHYREDRLRKQEEEARRQQEEARKQEEDSRIQAEEAKEKILQAQQAQLQSQGAQLQRTKEEIAYLTLQVANQLTTQVVLEAKSDTCLNISQIEIYDINGNKITPTNKDKKDDFPPPWSPESNVSKLFDGANTPRAFPNNYHTAGSYCKTGTKIIFKIDPVQIKKIIIYNRSDCCSNRIAQFRLYLKSANDQVISTANLIDAPVQTIDFTSSNNFQAQNNQNQVPYNQYQPQAHKWRYR